MESRPYLVLDTSFIAANIIKDGPKALIKNSRFLRGTSFYLRPIVLTYVISELEHLVFETLGFKDDDAKKGIDRVKRLTIQSPAFSTTDYTTKYRTIKEEALPIGERVSRKMGMPNLSDTDYRLGIYSFFSTLKADVVLATMDYPLRRTVEVMNEESLPRLREYGLNLKPVRVVPSYHELKIILEEQQRKNQLIAKAV